MHQEEKCTHADLHNTSGDGFLLVTLCYFCVLFYVVRITVQPLIIILRGWRAIFSEKSTFSEEWDKDAVWYTAITFNTLLMLPSLMFVRNAYRDQPAMVKEAFVHLGRKGWKDTLPGILLLLMVLKKTINFYLIVRFLEADDDTNIDDQKSNQQYISIGLLIAHFSVTLYTMMIPKLMNSQTGKQWVRIAKSVGLLTIALVDWGNLVVTMMAITSIQEFERNTASCDNGAVILSSSKAAFWLLILRVGFQLSAYLYLRYTRGAAPASVVRFTGACGYNRTCSRALCT